MFFLAYLVINGHAPSTAGSLVDRDNVDIFEGLKSDRRPLGVWRLGQFIGFPETKVLNKFSILDMRFEF